MKMRNLVAKNNFNRSAVHTPKKGKRVPRHVQKRQQMKEEQ